MTTPNAPLTPASLSPGSTSGSDIPIQALTPITESQRSRGYEAWIGFATTLRREIHRILRIWAQTILPPVISTSLYFIIFGPVLGARIGVIDGYSYLQYVTPGLIMMAILTNSYQNVVSSFFGAKFQNHVEEMLVSPMSTHAILLGYALGGVFRGLTVGATIALISLFFSELPIVHPFLTLSVAVLTAVAFALGGFINAMLARNFDEVSIFPTFVLAPLTMLGGVFYSINMLPDFGRTLSYANPILYMVNAFRFGILGTSDLSFEVAFAVLSLFIIGFYTLANFMLRRGVGIRS